MQNSLSPASPRFAAFDAVAIAASLGGPEALSLLLARLPPDFPAAIFIAQHMGAGGEWLVSRLSRLSALPVHLANDGEPIIRGRVYLAPPDRHLLVAPTRRVIVNQEPKVKFCRPAAEPLFTSVAALYRDRALGVVLTGCNTDGSVGVQSIKWLGGRVLVQDPATCTAVGMPQSAIRTGAVDFVLPLEKIASALVGLVMVRGLADYLKVSRRAA